MIHRIVQVTEGLNERLGVRRWNATDIALSVAASYDALRKDNIIMAIERQSSQSVALYARWAAMWNEELEISEQVMAERFVAHLTADATTPAADICGALRGWIQAVQSRSGEIG
jgi:hypothetical protein